MSKKERIAALESRVAELERRLDAMLAAGANPTVNVRPFVPGITIPCSGGTDTVPLPGVTWSTSPLGVSQ